MSAISSHQLEILGLGMSMMDSILMVDAFPEISGVTEVVESVMMGGGPVPTALCAASRLGAKAGIIDRIGLDWAGELIRDDYRDYGVSTQHLQLEQGCRSSFGTVLVRRSDGERHIVFRAGDFTPLAKEELPVEALEHCSILHLNGRHWPACIDAARLVREKGGRVSFDGGAHRFDEKFLQLLPLVDILVVASDFAAKLSGSIERDAQLEALAQWNASVVGITDGESGSWFLDKEGNYFHQPTYPVDSVVDTTGCGDVFHGTFLFAANRGDSWKKCASLASAAAACNAAALGGRGHLPTISEVERYLA